MKNVDLKEEYKLLADFCGYTYIPFEKKGQKFVGWYWLDPRKMIKDYPVTDNDKTLARTYICRNTKDLMFKYDFNRLMRVVEKIEEIGRYRYGSISVCITGNTCRISIPESARIPYNKTIEANNKLFAIYDSCKEFIKWYNTNA